MSWSTCVNLAFRQAFRIFLYIFRMIIIQRRHNYFLKIYSAKAIFYLVRIPPKNIQFENYFRLFRSQKKLIFVYFANIMQIFWDTIKLCRKYFLFNSITSQKYTVRKLLCHRKNVITCNFRSLYSRHKTTDGRNKRSFQENSRKTTFGIHSWWSARR